MVMALFLLSYNMIFIYSSFAIWVVPMMINRWKIDFVQIKFHSNENIEWKIYIQF
jgi:hypothetical protein